VVARLVILDRDGVINHDSDEFIRTPDEWRPIDGSLEAIATLSAAGFEVAVATNQSGVGRGLIDKPTLEAIHDKMRKLVREAGGDIGRIVYCPHHPDDGCDCRKPAVGLLRQLSRYYGLSLDGVPMIGDSLRDVDAALSAGGRPILVLTGNGRRTLGEVEARCGDVECYADLATAAEALSAELKLR
jgi:D-glycero-D-manno-heptose 1,7-bisphosphate phosphatase